MEPPGEHSGAGFWTLTRPSKLSKRRNTDLHELHHKVFNISVVGLSGVEKDKGPIGIGKSCLCNRFIRSAADDYHVDHISVLSQSDFGGRVVNNDHWLYWGSVIKSCEGYDLAFNVVEQTEFVDDACFQPFKSGKTEPYYKRCANTKLVSPEKLMYICKNQLGIEREYEQRYLADGKFNVDGFLCLFDVSQVQGRDIDKQIEMTNLILLNLIKTKKPIVFVATKYDEANEILVAEAERLVNQRDFRGLVPIVETSAQENVNINMAFLVCAQLIDKTRAKLRVTPFHEAYKSHLHLLNAATEDYKALIRSTVIDYNCSWKQVCIKLSHNPEFLRYTYLHGLDEASRLFKNHIQRLRSTCINTRVQCYLEIFPDILNELVPTPNLTPFNDGDNNNETTDNHTAPIQTWENVKEQIRSHPLFGKYFISVPPGVNWFDTELLQTTDTRIPFDWLNSEEAFNVYQQRNFLIETEQKRQRTKEMFAQMLANTKISVGKPFIELKPLLASNSSLDILSEQELFKIYVEYQNNLLQQARYEFQELLLENAEHLHHLTSSNKVIRQDDIKTINAILQHDDRYQALDRFDQDRTLMMIRHLSFLHSQSSEQCPSYPKCVEPEVERLLITKAKSIVSRFYESKTRGQNAVTGETSHLHKTCDLMIIGPRRPSQQLILALNVLNSRAPKGSQFQITFTVFENAEDVDNQHQRLRQADSRPKGCLGIFTNRRSLEHVNFTLQKFLHLTSQVKNDKNHFGVPPIVMLYAADITLDESTMLSLENEGQKVADQFKCPFMNVTAIDQYRQHQQNTILAHDQDLNNQAMSECASLDYACVDAAFSVLKEAISRKVCFMELYNNQDLIPRQALNPDAKILVCLLCGEPYSTDLFMWKAFLNLEDCYVTSSKSICFKTKLEDGQPRYLELIITSYTHGAFNYRDDLLHGFILVCSLERKASISILNAFSFNIPCTPVLVLAIKSDSSTSGKFEADDDDEHLKLLVDEAEAAARRLKGHFEILDLASQSKSTSTARMTTTFNDDRMKSFLTNVLNWKPTIERAYDLGDREIPLPPEVMPVQENNRTIYHQSKPIPRADDNQKPKHLSQVKGASSNYYATADLSSDEELMDGSNEKSYSDESEAYSSLSNSGQSKPVSTSKEATDQRTEGPKEASLSNKDANDNLSDDDTEDSTDNNKPDKPKPGKLDLSQYNNITNAIGKLNVQPASKSLGPEPPPPKLQQHSPVIPSQERSGFFKSRTRKAKNQLEDSARKVKAKDDTGEQIAVEHTVSTRMDRKLPQIPSSFDKSYKESPLSTKTGLAPRKSAKEIPASSSRQKSSQNSKDPLIPHSPDPTSELNPSNDVGDSPRPAPRSGTVSSSLVAGGSGAVSTFASSSNMSKRASNNRRNHGRAVAPPQLPGFSSSLDMDYPPTASGSIKAKNAPSEIDLDVDYSQSPIAQRLIRCLKDHKVSELNSPPESDIDMPHSSRHKFSRDQNLGTENNSPGSQFLNSSIDSSELINSRGAAIRQLNEILANKQPHGRFGMLDATRTPSLDQDQAPVAVLEVPPSAKKSDKDSKREKKKLRDDEKLEKRRIKEEERMRRQEKKQAGKKSKLTSPVADKTVDDDGIPFFIKRCIEFIEFEGLDAEGIYRVPGNRAHVDAFVQKLQENPDMPIVEFDVPVNAVATSLKDFLSKKWSPIIPLALMNELTEFANIPDKEQRVNAVKQLVQRLPPANYRLLKYVFGHFVKISLNHTLNSMDSKNLAICWWPTLLPLHFSDMVMFEQMRPHLEESIQTMIDQYDYIFDSEAPQKLVGT